MLVRPESVTQAYHAGMLVSKVENFLPKEDIPPVGVCAANFHALRELFGERLWQKLKARLQFRQRLLVYEALTYQPGLPKELIGTNREFWVGYLTSYNMTKRKKAVDARQRAVEGTARKLASHVKGPSLIV